MRKTILKFRRDENGAVTVDWVVLCAGVVALAAAIVIAMENNAVGLGDRISLFMDSIR